MTELIYLDDDNNIVDSDKATHAILRELDEKGNLIKETFAEINDKHRQDNSEIELGEPTPEMKKVLDEFKRNNSIIK